ncbi:MAG: fused DSP-PTPase phosphatase/NAD kinase-like protein [Bryobacteraceae bacterium]
MSLFTRLPIALLALGLPVFAGPVPGIKNFDEVDTHVYRGAQPTGEGLQYLAQLGVKTIVDLREPGHRSKAEELAVTAAGMQYVNVPMSGLTPPTDAEISKILGMLEDKTSGPVFVHCMRGADRTGAVIAAYHIDHDSWDNAHALQDAKAHGMSPFQLPRQSYIRNFHARTISPTDTSASAATNTIPVAATPATAGAK